MSAALKVINHDYFLAYMLATILVALILFFLAAKRNTTIPAVKKGYPFFGQVFDMIKGSPWDKMTKWVMEYGPIYRLKLFGSEAVVVADPAMLKVVLSTKLSAFKKDTVWTYKPFMVLLGNGLVTAEGTSWRNQRILLSAHLRVNILDDIPAMALKAVQRLCTKLEKAKKEGTVVEMAEEFRHLTLQVIAEAVLSLSPEESDQTFAHMYLPIVEEGNMRIWNPERMYIPGPAMLKFNRDVAKLNNYVTGLIQKRWALRQQEASSPTPTSRRLDVLDKALDAYTPAEWNSSAIQQIRDEVKTFILAGHETSASMLTWALYELTKKPLGSSMKRALAEANDVYKGHRSSEASGNKVISLPDKEGLDKLVFTDCCLRESLRKYSNVPSVVRIAKQDIQLQDYFIHKDSTIMICMQGVHHNPKYWPEPLEYKPERFLEKPAPYTFLPFVEGPRMCIGQYLSLLESKIVLSVLLSTFKFELMNPEDAGEKHPFMVPIIPKAGHFMKIH